MAELSKREKVYHVFQQISQTYDRANGRISLGMESRWKDCLIEAVCEQAAKAAVSWMCAAALGTSLFPWQRTGRISRSLASIFAGDARRSPQKKARRLLTLPGRKVMP